MLVWELVADLWPQLQHMQDVNYAKLTSMHFHAFRKGLKTGMYYLRTKPATDAIKFTVDPELLKAETAKTTGVVVVTETPVRVPAEEAKQSSDELYCALRKDGVVCVSCGS